MTDTLLDKISKHPNNTYITDAWLTGQTGEIVDLKGDCVFRFVDYDTEGELRKKEFVCRHHVPTEKKKIKALNMNLNFLNQIKNQVYQIINNLKIKCHF